MKVGSGLPSGPGMVATLTASLRLASPVTGAVTLAAS